MNDLINELKQQATNPGVDGDEGGAYELNIEKFAELIVRECIHIHKELSDASVVYDLGKGKELTPEQFILRCFGIQ